MSTSRDPLIDSSSPGRPSPPERPFYAQGVLLDAADFTAGEIYHRGRLARVLAYLHGHGTVAGLEVVHEPAEEPSGEAPEGREERVRVRPGLAIDRHGRLLELGTSLCLRLDRWYRDQEAGDLAAARDAGGAGALFADVFVRFVLCPRGRTPAFAAGPFDALDASVPSRLRDGGEASLVLRREAEPPRPGPPPFQDIDPGAAEQERLRALRDALLGAFEGAGDGGGDGGDGLGELEPLAEHVAGQDRTSLLLARLRLPVSAELDDDGRPLRDGEVTVDNHLRRFVYPPAALARYLGFSEDLP